jgi:hypothetical protein
VESFFTIFVAWLPVALMLFVFGYFCMKVVGAHRRSAAALEKIAQKLTDIDARLSSKGQT